MQTYEANLKELESLVRLIRLETDGQLGRTCLVCNKDFKYIRINKKYCSIHCRKIAKSRNYYRKNHPKTIKMCVICGEHFYAVLQRAKTCSKVCSKKYKNKLIKNWDRQYRPLRQNSRRRKQVLNIGDLE